MDQNFKSGFFFNIPNYFVEWEMNHKKFLTVLVSIYAVNFSKFQNYLTSGVIVKVF